MKFPMKDVNRPLDALWELNTALSCIDTVLKEKLTVDHVQTKFSCHLGSEIFQHRIGQALCQVS